MIENLNKNIENYKDALASLKNAKPKVGDKEMSDKFYNLSKFTENVIKYFEDSLCPKQTVKSGNTAIILKKDSN